MVVNRRRKSSRQQGSCTHGWGKNKHRNSGSRGGFGNAGTGKKSHNKKPSIWASDYFGKHGFVSKNSQKVKSISLKDVEQKIPVWIKEKKVLSEDGKIVVNLTELGYDKLIGNGNVKRLLKITVSKASKGVKGKIDEAKGELMVDKA